MSNMTVIFSTIKANCIAQYLHGAAHQVFELVNRGHCQAVAALGGLVTVVAAA